MAKVIVDDDALKEWARPVVEGREDSVYLIEQLQGLMSEAAPDGEETTYTEEEHNLELDGLRAELEASHRAEVERLFFVGDAPDGADEAGAETEETEETEDGASFEFAEDVKWS